MEGGISSSGNFRRLTAEGLIAGSGKLPDELFAVVEELSEEEVELLIEMKDRLEAAARQTGESDWKFMVPF